MESHSKGEWHPAIKRILLEKEREYNYFFGKFRAAKLSGEG